MSAPTACVKPSTSPATVVNIVPYWLLEVFTQISVSLAAVTAVAFTQTKSIVPIAPAVAVKLLGVPGTASTGALKSSFNTLGKVGVKIV